jgi:hypothetical protein
MASDVLKQAQDLIKKGKSMKPNEKVKLLPEVGKVRGMIFKQYRGKKMPSNVRKILSELGKTFPPTLYKLRKTKRRK